jgi:hypothetical protein
VVRHHASAYQDQSSYTVLPVFDQAHHTYGLTVAFTPSNEQLQGTVQRLRKLPSFLERKRSERPRSGDTTLYLRAESY